ncbi:MAG TPA: hypothetical protein VGX68_15850 [Thermoanaerobaculia bacterium]|jgi:endonuclease III|nr:hypothetical protein [Thermoanaerobaculia bacterium]
MKNHSPKIFQKPRDTIGALRKRIRLIVEKLHAAYGEADLGNLENPVDELVFISLTRRTSGRSAHRSWNAVANAGGPATLVDMPEEVLTELLRSGGFSRQKARWIKQSLDMVRREMGALNLDATLSWSDEKLEQFLRSLPGINIKSAKCIMLYSMGRQVLPVDTHVRRVAARIGLVSEGLSESRIHRELEMAIPRRHRFGFHVNSVWHGRLVCKAPRPNCDSCIIRQHCDTGRSKHHKESTNVIGSE